MPISNVGGPSSVRAPDSSGTSAVVIQAEKRWKEPGHKTPLTTLIPTRGAPDLLQDKAALESHKKGEFRAGRGPSLSMYTVNISGPDDRLEPHLLVGQPVVGKDDRPTGEVNYYDLGLLAERAASGSAIVGSSLLVTKAETRWSQSLDRTPVTSLLRGRGLTDPLQDKATLEGLKVGEFRDGRGPMLSVYAVDVAGADDRTQTHLIVGQPLLARNDLPTGEMAFYDLGAA